MDEERIRAEWEEQVSRHLDRLTGRLVAGLRPIVRAEQPPGTYLIEFEAHIDGFDKGFPISCAPWEDDDRPLDEYRMYLLTDVPFIVPDEVLNVELTEHGGLARVGAWGIIFRIFASWFADCWHEAGGQGCAYPAYLVEHGGTESLDLKQRKWVRDSEKWPWEDD